MSTKKNYVTRQHLLYSVKFLYLSTVIPLTAKILRDGIDSNQSGPVLRFAHPSLPRLGPAAFRMALPRPSCRTTQIRRKAMPKRTEISSILIIGADLADATYIEPITPEVVAKIIERERPMRCCRPWAARPRSTPRCRSTRWACWRNSASK